MKLVVGGGLTTGRHKQCGHLIAGRTKALLVDGFGNGYLPTVWDYVHLNPVRAKLVLANVPLSRFRWSSHGEYLKAPAQRPAWLRVDQLQMGSWTYVSNKEQAGMITGLAPNNHRCDGEWINALRWLVLGGFTLAEHTQRHRADGQ